MVEVESFWSWDSSYKSCQSFNFCSYKVEACFWTVSLIVRPNVIELRGGLTFII